MPNESRPLQVQAGTIFAIREGVRQPRIRRPVDRGCVRDFSAEQDLGLGRRAQALANLRGLFDDAALQREVASIAKADAIGDVLAASGNGRVDVNGGVGGPEEWERKPGLRCRRRSTLWLSAHTPAKQEIQNTRGRGRDGSKDAHSRRQRHYSAPAAISTDS